ncbi:MAG: hypothetical protein WAU86_23085 [Oricola sp.]
MTPADAVNAQKKTFNRAQLRALFQRVGATIEAETKILRKNPAAGLSGFNARKNRCLYELNLVSRDLSRDDMDDDIRAELRSLRKKVDENSAVLRACMTATKDVITILGDAIERAESDGTYPQTTYYSMDK